MQIIITARRDGGKLTTVSREVTGQAGGDNWDPLCEIIINRMIREGVLPKPDRKEVAR